MTFLLCFVIGGLTGIILANPPVNFHVHNSLFLVAHFYNMLIPGTTCTSCFLRGWSSR